MRVRALLFAALVLPALAIGQDWRGPAGLEVQVEDAKGKNLPGAEILLVYLSPEGGGLLPSVLTDANGKANIAGLAAGRWNAEVRHAGHMSYRAELSLSADGKPVVESAAHQMAPGASSTMKVKFSRGRGGGAPVASKASATRPVEPAATPAARPAPVAEVPQPPAEKAPVKEGTSVPSPRPPAVQPPISPAQPPAVSAPLPAKQTPNAPPGPATSTTGAGALPPPVAAAPVAPVAPVTPQVQRPVAPPAPVRQHLCVECPPGETAAWGEAAIAGGATAGCPADLAARLKGVALGGLAQLSTELGPGCRVLAVELPAGARFTGFRYEAQSQGVTADCLPGRGCPAGDCRFPSEPVVRQEGNRTVLLVGFESTAPDLRRALVAGYSTYSKK